MLAFRVVKRPDVIDHHWPSPSVRIFLDVILVNGIGGHAVWHAGKIGRHDIQPAPRYHSHEGRGIRIAGSPEPKACRAALARTEKLRQLAFDRDTCGHVFGGINRLDTILVGFVLRPLGQPRCEIEQKLWLGDTLGERLLEPSVRGRAENHTRIVAAGLTRRRCNLRLSFRPQCYIVGSMKILVTGTSGFVGGAVGRYLRLCGHHVTGLSRRAPRAEACGLAYRGAFVQHGVALAVVPCVRCYSTTAPAAWTGRGFQRLRTPDQESRAMHPDSITKGPQPRAPRSRVAEHGSLVLALGAWPLALVLTEKDPLSGLDTVTKVRRQSRLAPAKLPDGVRHTRRYQPIASATAMRVIPTPIARNWLDRSVSIAEKRRRQARKMRVRGPIPARSKRLRDHRHRSGRKRLLKE